MSLATGYTDSASLAQQGGPSRPAKPFAGLLDAVLVEGPVTYYFAGSVVREHASAAWTWVWRDLCPDLISADAARAGTIQPADLEYVMPEIIARIRQAQIKAGGSEDESNRLRAALGSAQARDALPNLLNVLRGRLLLEKAQAFGRAINAMADDAALSVAIQSMPLQDPPLASVLFHAALAQVSNPTRVITTVIRLSGGASEGAIARAGFTPVIEALVAHAQNQLHTLRAPAGAFADIDLVCRAIERFHRLVRALTGYVEFHRTSHWTAMLSVITRQVSDRLEPRLRDVVPQINMAMRRGREGSPDRLDSDTVLAAINGVYVLSAVRDARDSLALNALFEQVWRQSEQALELYLQRNLELHRDNPDDAIVAARLEAGIKMAEIRFNLEYAETMRRARAAAERRA